MAAPVQVVIEPANFHQDLENEGGGRSTEFFANRDVEFVAHRDDLVATLRAFSATLQGQTPRYGGLDHLKVTLRRAAWAKSHRPFKSLFKSGLTPCVGGLDLGQLLIEVTPEKLSAVAAEIAKAEPETRFKPDSHGVDKPNPTRRRSETGAIEKIELYGPTDRRHFDIDTAMTWLSQAGIGQSYEVELFEPPIPLPQLDTLDTRRQRLHQSFVDGLAGLGQGLTVTRLLTGPTREAPRLAVRLEQSILPPNVQLLQPAQQAARTMIPFDASRDRHSHVLKFLEEHPLVRSIQLPGRLTRSAPSPRTRPASATLPTRDRSRAYPRVGVIDGGVAAVADDWIVGRWEIVDDSDVDDSHGTFISGLLIAGSAINGSEVVRELDGIEIYDARVLPRKASYPTYYSNLDQFMAEVEQAIIVARNQHGVRVFNFSLNVESPVTSDRYSRWATRLDQFADDHDVVIFISAGNLEEHPRGEWPATNDLALAMLAASQDDIILAPAESARNASVGALNPPGLAGALAHAPARYTRRGPGLRALVKPDFVHVGGVGHPPGNLGHGLFSIGPAGAVADNCGTSFATPLLAKTAARLDHLVEGALSRETMLALLVHHAQRPPPLRHKIFDPVARQLVGHGMPLVATEMLEGHDHEITLVFATRLPRDKQLVFPFVWPPSLTDDGSCRGYARLTVVASPPLDARFGAEFVRINIDAALQQYNPKTDGWQGRLSPAYLPPKSVAYPIEAERIEHGLKWSPVKIWETNRKGIGASSDWRLVVSYLARAGVTMPDQGVPLTAILTIRDPDASNPVFDQMRQWLTSRSVRLEDIRTAARVLTRV